MWKIFWPNNISIGIMPAKITQSRFDNIANQDCGYSQCATVIVNPVFTVTDAPVFAVMLRQTPFEFTTTVPLFMITSVLASGMALQLQLAAFSHALLTEPFQ